MAIRITRLAVMLALILSSSFSVAEGRSDSGVLPKFHSDVADALATVSGGGTVLASPTFPTTVASFGVSAEQPAGFVGGGSAVGRINYDRHAKSAKAHVRVPVVLMAAEVTATPSPNGTGGSAILVGDCSAEDAECPAGILSVVVYVEDNADSGAGVDVFRISFCAAPPSLPSPSGCSVTEGGSLRSGNIQVGN